jgi:CRISPR-associated endonuclease Csn1
MKYSLGLDIGTASVGWAVVNEDKYRIEDLGVRIFESPENPKNGESLAKPRRDARSARRRLKRRRQRLNYLKSYFIEQRFLTNNEIRSILTPRAERGDPYELRELAISEKLPHDELFIALYHIAKRRGYKSNRKAVAAENKENGKVLKAISENQQLLTKYRTVAHALVNEAKFAAHKRNKRDDYTNSFIREDFEKEIIAILITQGWQEAQINDLLYAQPNGLFYQRPFMTSELVEKMRGRCPLERDEPRAQKASVTFELFRVTQELSHLTYNDGTKLTPEQIIACIERARETRKVTYKAVREVIGHKLDLNFKFDYIRGKQAKTYEEMEKNTFCELRFYHDIKASLNDIPEEWIRVSGDTELFDQIGYILTANKDDQNIERELKKISIANSAIPKLITLSFAGFGHLSIKALKKLTPHLLNGETYDKSVEAEYPGEFSAKLFGDKNELPPLTEEEQNQITNPVVKRAISQTRKVINAIIRKYGAPYQIKIECANDLSKGFDERRKIKTAQDENAENNLKIIEKLKELGIPNPAGTQITKYKLREQQLCKCVYCGKTLDVEILLDDRASEIDHIIPFSRCGNDGNGNKVLTCTTCNQEKTNKTPFEAWGSNEKRWEIIKNLINSIPMERMHYTKKNRILGEKPPKEEWNVRALNDTRYIMRFMSNYVKRNLAFSDDSTRKQKVILPTGFITSYLRKMYKIGGKDRGLNNCHHAVDACIVATVSQSQIQKFALWNKYKELGARYHTVMSFDDNDNAIQVTTKEYERLRDELLPWENFDKEVCIRSGMSYDSGKIEDLREFRDKFRQFHSYNEEFLSKVSPMFVSRMPKRSATGKAHKETIRSPKSSSNDKRLTRMRIADITLTNLENSILPSSDKVLYEQLKKLLSEKGKDALKEPIYKNNKRIDKNGLPISPVTTIKIYSTEPSTSGIITNKGTQFMNNGDTVCLNIYSRGAHDGSNKFFCAPVYVHKIHSKKVAILPTPNGRSVAEKAGYAKIRSADGTILASAENGFKKIFSIYPNDYIRITYNNTVTEGYYVKYGISNGALTLVSHNVASKDDTKVIHCSVGTAKEIELLRISVLGDNYKRD